MGTCCSTPKESTVLRTQDVALTTHALAPVEQKQDDPVPVQVVAAGRGHGGCVCGVGSRLDWSVVATVAGSAIAGSAVVRSQCDLSVISEWSHGDLNAISVRSQCDLSVISM